ncbi:hypothetical protein F5X96DRAFT_675798 [Biscogniauxia mediterranea]|nr:hypothetical protein F5X96DRAFT_675798 [Biscogniauxia mediterranea]
MSDQASAPAQVPQKENPAIKANNAPAKKATAAAKTRAARRKLDDDDDDDNADEPAPAAKKGKGKAKAKPGRGRAPDSDSGAAPAAKQLSSSCGAARELPCVRCVRRLARDPSAVCHDTTGTGTRCWECSEHNHGCPPEEGDDDDELMREAYQSTATEALRALRGATQAQRPA